MNHSMQCHEAYVYGGNSLKGVVTTSGSKNASFPILAASLLTEEPCFIRGIPRLRDMEVMLSLLKLLGTDIQEPEKGLLRLQSASPHEEKKIPDSGLIQKIRGSIYLLGALLIKQRYVEMTFPGGCSIGARPIDLHIRGFEKLGAHVEIQKNKVILSAPQGLKGASIFLGGPAGGSVTGTADIVMSAVLAKGWTRIEYAACEPEVAELCQVLVSMGAHIEGIGSPILEIKGVELLSGFSHTISADRIEAGTWMLMTLCTGHSSHPIVIEHFPQKSLGALLFILNEMGANWDLHGDCMQIKGGQDLKAAIVHALPYPGFPTDLQAPMAVLMTLAQNGSEIHDHIYPQRFLYAKELERMGAHIETFSGGLRIHRSRLRGTKIQATDLRASAALYMAGLMAEGVTQITGAEHIDRGYEQFEEKLCYLGAHLERKAIDL